MSGARLTQKFKGYTIGNSLGISLHRSNVAVHQQVENVLSHGGK